SNMDIRNSSGLGLNDRSSSARVTPAEEKAATALNTFAFKLIGSAFGEGKTNVIISPTGAALALRLLEEAAEGPTQVEIKNALRGFRADKLAATTGLRASLWSQDGAPGQEGRPATVGSLKSEGALEKWLEESVPGLEGVRLQTSQENLALLSAGRLQLKPQRPFDQTLTKPTLFGGSEHPFLHGSGAYRAFVTKAVQVVEIPLAEAGLALRVVVPADERVPIKSFLKELSEKNWSLWQRSLIEQQVDLALPKMRLRSSLELAPVLEKVGVKKAFLSGAGLKKLANAPAHVEGAKQVLQLELGDAKVEEGMAPAPATTANLKVIANRPFALFLIEPATGSIAAAALVVKPEWSEPEAQRQP
ncbi:MAG TPA: serpin family protein, partial [Fimbriimonadaceae bacterium]|nr:serpin family protein [Fimbriimonadaceae bacterium]